MKSLYHYTECGIDNVYLVNGYNFVDVLGGRSVVIQDMDGLHKAIGMILVIDRKQLSGQEIRYLRTELLLSQSGFGRVLDVDAQTVARWEKNKIPMPRAAEAALRVLYAEHVGFDAPPPSVLGKSIILGPLRGEYGRPIADSPARGSPASDWDAQFHARPGCSFPASRGKVLCSHG